MRMPAALCLMLVSAPAMAAEPVAQLRADAPAFDPGQIRRLGPAGEAAALLQPGHPPAQAAYDPSWPMAPPAPPGLPVHRSVRLDLEGGPSVEPGFCERPVVTVRLKPVDRRPDGGVPPAQPGNLYVETAYRLLGKGPDQPDCAAPKMAFFIPEKDGAPTAFFLVRMLAEARSAAANRAAPLPFPITFEDRLGPAWAAYACDHPGEPAVVPISFADGRSALAALPVEFVSSTRRALPRDSIAAADLRDAAGRSLQPAHFFVAGIWSVSVLHDGARIARMHLLRELPAPF